MKLPFQKALFHKNWFKFGQDIQKIGRNFDDFFMNLIIDWSRDLKNTILIQAMFFNKRDTLKPFQKASFHQNRLIFEKVMPIYAWS